MVHFITSKKKPDVVSTNSAEPLPFVIWIPSANRNVKGQLKKCLRVTLLKGNGDKNKEQSQFED